MRVTGIITSVDGEIIKMEEFDINGVIKAPLGTKWEDFMNELAEFADDRGLCFSGKIVPHK